MDNVTLAQLRAYLPSQGWSLISAPDDFVEVWRLDGAQEGELLLPTEEAIDKEFLLSEALAKLARLVDRSISSLSQDAREYSENTISIRVVHPDVNDGSIPLEDGIALNKNAKELISAAANAALERRPLYLGRPPALVSSLIESARLGQTAHGSYVIHVFCKDPAQNEQPTDFAQVTTETLQSALAGLRDALDRYAESGNSLVFESAFSRGASANLCEALSKLSGKDRARTVEISLVPRSAGRLTPAHRTTVEFSPSHQPSLRAAADYFRQTYTLDNEIVLGAVERLERAVEQDSGVIRIAATLSNGAQRSVRLQLSPDDYQEAIHAHENKMMVQVIGTVVVTPRTANILEPRGFGAIGNYRLFDDSE
jgi:hypothetical protein